MMAEVPLPGRAAMRDRIALTVILAASLFVRILIAVRGGQYFWTDESRFVLAQRVAGKFWSGDFRQGFDALFSNSGHMFFEVIGVVPAALEKALGGAPYIPAIFFGAFSVGVIYLVYLLVRAQGGSSREGVFAAFLMASCNAFFYYARHIFPYDLALCFHLGSCLIGFRPGRRNAFLAGVLAGFGFLTYNAYWVFGGAVLAITVLNQRQGFLKSAERGLFTLAGLLAPIVAALGVGHLFGHNLLKSFVEFSHVVASDTGDRGIAWRVIPEYLWVSEHNLALLLGLGIIASVFLCLSGRADARLSLWVAGGFLLYAGQVVVFDVLKIFFICARHARPVLVFLCLAGGWILARMSRSGRTGRISCGLIVVGVLVQAALNFRVPITQVFPPEFEKQASDAIQADKERSPGLYGVLLGGFGESAEDEAARSRPCVVLLQRAHPLQFMPYTFDDYTEVMRKMLPLHDISMRAVRWLPERPDGRAQVFRSDGSLPSFPGAVRLEVIFDPKRLSEAQPLVCTGRSGAGDELFVEFLSRDTLRIGFDHWSMPAVYSPPIRFSLGKAHVLDVSFGPLFPDAAGPARGHPEESESLRRALYVAFDGGVVLFRHADYYPSLPSETVLFHNYIGFSTAGRDFSGRLVSASSIAPREIISRIKAAQ